MSVEALQPAIDFLKARAAEIQGTIVSLENIRDGRPLAALPAASLPDRSPVELENGVTPPPQKTKRRYKRRGGFAAHPQVVKRVKPEQNGDAEAPKRRGRPRKADVTEVGAAAGTTSGSIIEKLEKPNTLAGAMKFEAKQLKTFTQAQLVAALKADPDFSDLLSAASHYALGYNLKYWSEREYLEKSGDGADATYKVVNLDF